MPPFPYFVNRQFEVSLYPFHIDWRTPAVFPQHKRKSFFAKLSKYMFEVSGVDGESQVTYIILTYNAETSFEEVAYSLRKAEMSTETPAFVILEWYY